MSVREWFEDINENGIYEEDYVGYQDTFECEFVIPEGYCDCDGNILNDCGEGFEPSIAWVCTQRRTLYK